MSSFLQFFSSSVQLIIIFPKFSGFEIEKTFLKISWPGIPQLVSIYRLKQCKSVLENTSMHPRSVVLRESLQKCTQEHWVGNIFCLSSVPGFSRKDKCLMCDDRYWQRKMACILDFLFLKKATVNPFNCKIYYVNSGCKSKAACIKFRELLFFKSVI